MSELFLKDGPQDVEADYTAATTAFANYPTSSRLSSRFASSSARQGGFHQTWTETSQGSSISGTSDFIVSHPGELVGPYD